MRIENKHSIPKQPQEGQPLSKRARITVQAPFIAKHVEDAVDDFLFPYLAGFKTEAMDPEVRLPLMTQLQVRFSGRETTPGQIQAIALKRFFQQAAQGLYMHRKSYHFEEGQVRWDRPGPIGQEDRWLLIVYLSAVTEGVRREFPNLNIDDEKIQGYAIDALNQHNVTLAAQQNERAAVNRAYQAAYRPGRQDRQKEKLEQLQRLGQLFFNHPEHHTTFS